MSRGLFCAPLLGQNCLSLLGGQRSDAHVRGGSVRLLPEVKPTAEQLPIVASNKRGVLLIKGAAGSGKTTTALMRLRQLCGWWVNRKRRLGLAGPVRILVLTFNRTLEGYIEALAREQVSETEQDLELEVSTFAKWAVGVMGGSINVEQAVCDGVLYRLCAAWGGTALYTKFLTDEVDYVLGRFQRGSLVDYVEARRDGRGIAPRMDTALRRRLLAEIIEPYQAEKARLRVADWNDLAIAAATATSAPWDVVVVDETQDFSANQLRAVLAHLTPEVYSATFVMDSAQQIYPRGFTWREVGVSLNPNDIHTLSGNYRNTKEIAAFAREIVAGIDIGDNGALPNLNASSRSGPKPTVLAGVYSAQMAWTLDNVVARANLAEESVAFLAPLGGNWFSETKRQLDARGIRWTELTRKSTWPGGDETAAICTLYSAKGLEFDHVIILGLNQQVTRHGDEAGDTDLDSLRRLLAMGVGRARTSVTIGYKPGEESSLVSLFAHGTFDLVSL